jgi:hypothetical protein
MSYTTKPTITLDQLANVNISDIENNDLLQYSTTNGVWENGDTLDISSISVNEININDGGKIKINNNAGQVGAVLTSNGDGEEQPSWDRPYFMVAGLESDYNITGSSSSRTIIDNMVERFSGDNYNFGNWDAPNNCWSCPVNGFYKITGCVRGSSNTTDKLLRLNAVLSRYNASDILQEDIGLSGMDLNTETSSEADIFSATCHRIIYITSGDRIKLRVNYELTSGDLQIKGVSASQNDEKTYLMVERIVKGTY